MSVSFRYITGVLIPLSYKVWLTRPLIYGHQGHSGHSEKKRFRVLFNQIDIYRIGRVGGQISLL